MKQPILYLLIVITSAILLSGCNFQNLFAQLATTNEEQGAREQYQRDQMLQAKQQRINEKKAKFAQTLQLTKINDTDSYLAFVFINPGDTVSQIDLEAILPNSGRQMYELWVRNPNNKDAKSLGVLQFNQTDDYSLSYSGAIDLKTYTNFMLTREANPDDQPETIIMTGALTTSTP